MELTPKDKAKVQKIMNLLDCTEEEAVDVIKTDNIIDKGGRTEYDLPIEKEKEIKKIYAVKDRMAKDKTTSQRGKVRAENLTKSGVISKLFEFLTENDEISFENVEILNKERQIAFKIGEDNYELTLVQKRKPKK
jgi:hypothetical protein